MSERRIPYIKVKPVDYSYIQIFTLNSPSRKIKYPDFIKQPSIISQIKVQNILIVMEYIIFYLINFIVNMPCGP